MIEIGAKLTVEKTVTPELTAQVAGSGLLPVFGTPFMTAMMENAAAGILQQYLEEGKGSVGTHLNVSHDAPTPVGMKVWAEAEITAVSENGKMIDFAVKAWDEKGPIGAGTHTRAIITNCILMGRLEAFSMMNKPWPSFLDGVGNGLGYALILVIMGAVREFLGRGSLLGFQLIPEGAYDFGYVNNGMMTMPAMALILVGCVIWVHRAYIYKEEK